MPVSTGSALWGLRYEELKQTRRTGGGHAGRSGRRPVRAVCNAWPMRRLALWLGGAAVAAVIAVGLAQTGGKDTSARPKTLGAGEIQRAYAGAAPELAALSRQANALLPGGRAGLEARLRRLRGTPVVVNVWGSWCGPCRAEFPHFQRQALAFAKRVAFIGVDTQDNRGNATKFLRASPVPYPSYEDPRGAFASSLHVIGLPVTVFYDRGGKRTIHQGPYRSNAELAADVRRYALGQA